MDINKINYVYISHLDIIRRLPHLEYFIDVDKYLNKHYEDTNTPFISIAYMVSYMSRNKSKLKFLNEPFVYYSYSIRSEYDRYVKSIGKNIARGRLLKFMSDEPSIYSVSLPLKECVSQFIEPGTIDMRYIVDYPEVLGYRIVENLVISSVVCNYINSL